MYVIASVAILKFVIYFIRVSVFVCHWPASAVSIFKPRLEIKHGTYSIISNVVGGILMKTVLLIVKLLVCFILLCGAIFGAYWLCGFLPPNNGYDIVYMILLYTLNYMIPALLALGYSLLVYAVLKNRPKRVIIALLNGVVTMGLALGAFLLLSMELVMYAAMAPAILIFSLILAVIFLALKPKKLPQTEITPEAVEESK